MSELTENREFENKIKIILKDFSKQELLNLIHYFDPSLKINVSASKDFLVNKILSSISYKDIIGYDLFSEYLFKKHILLAGFFEKIFDIFTKNELINICNDLGKEELYQDKVKKDIVYEILTKISYEDVFKSKNFRDRITPKYLTTDDLDIINKSIIELNNTIGNKIMKNNIDFNSIINKMDNMLNSLNIKNGYLDGLNTLYDEINYDVIKNYYENYTNNVGDEFTLSQLIKLIEKEHYNTKEKMLLILSSLELMTHHYILNNIKVKKSMNKNLFWILIKDEYDKIKKFDNKAIITQLRKNLNINYNIDEASFNEYLTDLWTQGKIRLDVGSPIGQEDIEYFITKTGAKYYYLSMVG